LIPLEKFHIPALRNVAELADIDQLVGLSN